MHETTKGKLVSSHYGKLLVMAVYVAGSNNTCNYHAVGLIPLAKNVHSPSSYVLIKVFFLHSLVPRPHHTEGRGPGIHYLRMHVIFTECGETVFFSVSPSPKV